MFARLTLAAVVAVVASGCATYVPEKIYNRDVNSQKEYIKTLEQRLAELEPKASALDQIRDTQLVTQTEIDLYQQIADSLKGALNGFKVDGEDAMNYDPRSGKWTAGTDLLFDSGSWTVTAKGAEVLKKFADAHKGKSVRFRIVGHTDTTPIVRPKTKDALETDTNMELSARRAIAVMGQLKKAGIGESQFVECVGMGSLQPASKTDKKKNRRVEIFVCK